jgi:3-hydroxyacyl-[acyl-carrier-protein] dehydratase
MRWMWIDRIVELVPRERLVAIKNVSLAEEHLHEHFEATPTRAALPIMPASLILEGMAQTAGLLVGHAGKFAENVVLAKVGSAEWTREVTPGQTLRYTATMTKYDATGASTSGTVEVRDSGSAALFEKIGDIDIMFSHAGQAMDLKGLGQNIPTHNFVFGEAFATLLRTSGFS